MKSRLNVLLIVALLLAATSLGEVFAASDKYLEEEYVTNDSGWVKVDDDTWTYTIEVEDTSLDWYAFEEDVPDGYYTVATEETPAEIQNDKVEIRNTGKEYSITFNPNGGRFAGSPINVSKRVNVNSKSSNTPGAAQRTGYLFGGWYVGDTMIFDEEGNAVDGEFWNGNGEDALWKHQGNVTAVAKWTVAEYAISYDLQGGEFGENHPSSGSFGESMIIDAPTRRGYAFMGWTVEGMDESTHQYGTSATSYTETNATSLSAEETLGKTWYKNFRETNGAITFKANWKANVYSVAYTGIENANIENLEREVKVGDTFVVNNPTKAGWLFDGWDISGMDDFTHLIGNEESNATSLTKIKATSFKNLRSEPGNITFTAKWTENIQTLTYKANGHGNNPSPVRMKYPDEVKAESIDYVKGYHLTEWNTKPDGTGEAYLPGKVVKKANTEPEAMTLYAIWEENTATISYDSNDGNIEDIVVPEQDTMRYTQEYKLPTMKPTRDGYTFKEWNTGRKGGGTSYQPGDVFKKANEEPTETTLYAIWTEGEAVVTYDANGHGTAPSPAKIYFSKEYNAEGAISADGWMFRGWNVKADGSGKMYQPGETVKGAKVKPVDLTLYAIWALETHTLTVDGNGGAPASQTYTMTVNSSENTRLTLPTKNGQECAGLYTRRIGGTMVYDAKGQVVNEGLYFKEGTFIYRKDLTLYAQYGTSQVPCVVYDQNTGDAVKNMPSGESKFIDKPITLSNLIPTRKGYNFVCWSTSPDAASGDCYYVQGGKGPVFPLVSDSRYSNYEEGPVTLYAIWQQTREEEMPKAKLPVKYNFYSSDVENGLLDAEITYKYRNFFRQQKEITVRRTLFTDTSQATAPELIIAAPAWSSGDEIPGLEGIERLRPPKQDEENPDGEEPKDVAEVNNGKELEDAINNWNYAEDGTRYIQAGKDITIEEPISIPMDAVVSIDLDNYTISASKKGSYTEIEKRTVEDDAVKPDDIAIGIRQDGDGSVVVMANGEPCNYKDIYLCDTEGNRLSDITAGFEIKEPESVREYLEEKQSVKLEVSGHLSNAITMELEDDVWGYAGGIDFAEWNKEIEVEVVKERDIPSTVFQVLGDLYVSNGILSATGKCVSLHGMAEFLAEDVVFDKAAYAVYFENGTGSAIAELMGSAVKTAVVCGSENQHSLLMVKGETEVQSNGLYADFTGKNPKGLRVEESYFIKDPSLYVDAKAFTVVEITGDYAYRVVDNGALPSVTIDAVINDEMMGSVSGCGDYPLGGMVTLTAAPRKSSEFVAWKGSDGKVLSRNEEWTFKVTGDTTVWAEFRWKPHTITGICDEEMGTVQGSGEYGESCIATLIAKAKDNYVFSHWEDSEGNNISTDATLEVEVQGDATYKAIFEAGGVNLSISVPDFLESVTSEESSDDEDDEEESGDEEEEAEEWTDEDEASQVTVTVNGKPLPKEGVVQARYGEQITVFAGTQVEGYSILGFYDDEANKYAAEGPYYEFNITEDTNLTVVLDIDDSKVSQLIQNFKENQADRIKSELATYETELLNEAQPVGSLYTSTDESLGKGEHYEDENATEIVENEEGEEVERNLYHVDVGLEKIEEKFGGEWERIENTFLYADGDEELGTMSGKMKYKLSAAMNVDSNSIAFVLENKGNFLNQSLEDVIKVKFSPITATPTNGVVAFDSEQGSRTTTVMPPYQSVYVFRRVS